MNKYFYRCHQLEVAKVSNPPRRIRIICIYLLFILFFILPSLVYSFPLDKDIGVLQRDISDQPVGERIAFWAEKFIGTPYDPDPLGEYVTKKVIVADERVDCMYLAFRTVELALSQNPDQAVEIALSKRFIHKGMLGSTGNVLNYQDRFQYAEDMIDSGKWGKEITANLGTLTEIKGKKEEDKIKIFPKKELSKLLRDKKKMLFKNGDVIFLIKNPDKRTVNEIVGHLGIIKIEKNKTYLIHAAGTKNKGGKVVKVLFADYVNKMPFVGIRASRFE